MISDDALNALKARHPVNVVAGEWVTLRRKARGKFIGPCPMCSDKPASKGAMRFECDSESWVCAVCADGGDVIRLVMLREGLGFTAAVDRLGGAREEVPTPALARKRGLRDYMAGVALGDPLNVPPAYDGNVALCRAWGDGWRDGKRRADYEAYARRRERERLGAFWRAGTRIAGTPVDIYLASRGLIAPANACLKFHPAMPLFCDGRESQPTVAHVGPAMLAAFYDAAHVGIGMHITWLDPVGPKGKALVHNPDTGEVLPSKKMRGTKAGGFIDLGGCVEADAARGIAGEGIETVLAVYTALVRAGRDVSHTLFRAAGDLGNLAGRAVASIAHPDLKTATGRPQRVPGPDPDLASPAMPVPDAVGEWVFLGDGDSDPFLTRHALERAVRRHASVGRIVRARFAAPGLDFNDMIQGKTR